MKKIHFLLFVILLTLGCALHAIPVMQPYVGIGGFIGQQRSSDIRFSGDVNQTPTGLHYQKNNGGADIFAGLTIVGKNKLNLNVQIEGLWISPLKQDFKFSTSAGSGSNVNNLQTKVNSLAGFITLEPLYKLSQQTAVFIDGGIGLSKNDAELSYKTEQPTVITDTNKKNTYSFAWKAGAGLMFSITPHWRVKGSIDYISFGKLKYGKYFQVQPISAGFDINIKKLYGYFVGISTSYTF